jgi:hypothetical protein
MTSLPDRPFTIAEVAELGISRKRLRIDLREGRVRRVFRGVYCPSGIPDSTATRARCAALVMQDHTALCDRTAAWLHGVDCLDHRELEQLPALEVVSVTGHGRVRRSGTSGGQRELLEDELCEIDGVLVTTAVRTALDLACLHGRNAALATLDAFMRHCDLTLADFTRCLPRYHRRRGVKQLRELIQYASPYAESAGESWTRMTMIDAGLPVPKLQHWVDDGGRPRYRLDLAYPLLKIAIEYDGEEFHTGDQFLAADQERRGWLRDNGWLVIVVRKSDFKRDTCEGWLAELREAVRERTPVRNRRYSRGETWGRW